MVAHLRERDPKHLAFINMLPILSGIAVHHSETPVSLYQDYLRSYTDVVRPDLLSYDYYHFFRSKSGEPFDDFHYFLNLSLIREAALAAHIPFMNIIQCSTFFKYWRLPNANELRWLVYTTLAYGARGISYFLYWGPAKYGGLYQDGKPISLIESVSKINLEIASLSCALMSLESTAVYHTAPLPVGTASVPIDCPVQIRSPGQFVLGLFARNGKNAAFMIVNRSYQSAVNSLVRVGEKKELREFDRHTRSWKGMRTDQNGNFSFKIEPGDGRLFEY